MKFISLIAIPGAVSFASAAVHDGCKNTGDDCTYDDSSAEVSCQPEKKSEKSAGGGEHAAHGGHGQAAPAA
ncbi:hypothetical protein ANO11243_054920 [Dothideomycetidae sp. 11243]|nr:hypothetical protein ANO11243_054920 [fungal sp. No.11243]